MITSIMWYVHDHGLGHLHRAMAVVPHLTAPVVVAAGPGVSAAASEAFGGTTVALPSDVDPVIGPTIGPWHYAPAGSAVRARSLAIAAAIERHHCTTIVVDVSAEVTVLARLLGLRVVTVRQSGRRNDPAHQIAFGSADVVWVPQHRELEPLGDEPVDERWQFTGAFSRFDGTVDDRTEACAGDVRTALLMVGGGGHSFDAEAWAGAPSPPGWRVVTAGVGPGGRVADVGPLLRRVDVVVCSAGWASVADVVACGARLVLVAEDRPFDEQLVRAERLQQLGLALHVDRWPDPVELPGVLKQAMSTSAGDWSRYHDGQGAQRAASMIERCHAS